MANVQEVLQNKHFPIELPNNVLGQIVDEAHLWTSISSINQSIFRPEELNLFQLPQSRQGIIKKLQHSFSHSLPEHIVFYDPHNNPVGWFLGYMEDEMTFFIDTVGLIPAYRSKGIYTTFLRKFLVYLGGMGYERVTTSHHPNNRAILIAELKAGFNIVGLELHESFGPLVKVAYFFHTDRQKGFTAAFSMASDPTANSDH